MGCSNSTSYTAGACVVAMAMAGHLELGREERREPCWQLWNGIEIHDNMVQQAFQVPTLTDFQ